MTRKNNTIWLSSCHSTNSYAKDWISGNAFKSGWTVSSYEQTAGRGQMGSSWEAEANKNLTFSTVYLFEQLQVKDLFYLNMAVSLAMLDLLHTMDIKACLKWPNDFFIGSK